MPMRVGAGLEPRLRVPPKHFGSGFPPVKGISRFCEVNGEIGVFLFGALGPPIKIDLEGFEDRVEVRLIATEPSGQSYQIHHSHPQEEVHDSSGNQTSHPHQERY